MPYGILLTMYADVLFPLKLPPLTYRVPEGMGSDIKGCIITAPLTGKDRLGLVVELRDEEPPGLTESVRAHLKDISSVGLRFASENHLQFLKWMSDYYLTPEGMTLKGAFFEEAAAERPEPGNARRGRKAGGGCETPAEELSTAPPLDVVADAVVALRNRRYSALLYHAPDIESEYAACLGIMEEFCPETRGAILLVPEVSLIDGVEPRLRGIFGERLAVLHGRLGKRDRRLAVHNILDGKADVILGTRSAMLAPLPHAEFVVVIEEQSPSYKAGEGTRYNARDLAVMRAYMDKSCALLMSACPSVESVYNVKRGKYRRLFPGSGQEDFKRPSIRIVTHRPGGRDSSCLSPVVVEEAGAVLRDKGQALFLAGRKGYSLLRCEDCGYTEYCSRCETSMVFYKNSGTLKCHHCGLERPAPQACPECGGSAISIFTAGADRVKEELEGLLHGPEAPSGKAFLRSPQATEETGVIPYIIGAGMKRKKADRGRYSAAVLMNIDLLAARPDFRAHERAFQETLGAAQLVRPEGRIIIQTRSGGSKFLRRLRDYDFEGFYETELRQRRELAYPPFERMILLSVLALPGAVLPDCGFTSGDDKVKILGPVEAPTPSGRYASCVRIILKSGDNKRLREEARKIVNALEKNRKIRIMVDVDPLKI
jgi:primosomal protein N' (replication factor Y)